MSISFGALKTPQQAVNEINNALKKSQGKPIQITSCSPNEEKLIINSAKLVPSLANPKLQFVEISGKSLTTGLTFANAKLATDSQGRVDIEV